MRLIVTSTIGLMMVIVGFMMWTNRQYEVPKPLITPTPQPTEYTETSTTFLAVGDIMLSRGVDQAIRKKNNPLLPFENMKDVFESVDFCFANFEAPINGTDFAGKSGSLVFNVPVKNIEGLKKYRFEMLSLANNHALDQGESALQYTQQILNAQGLQTVGTGETKEQAWEAKIIEKNDIRIAFIAASYTAYNDNGVRENEKIARMHDTEYLKKSIENAKKKADFVIVSMHAGVEYVRKPNTMQQQFARQSIDFGADMVIGHHPHWIQIIEEYKGKTIFYSLGNFIFDQEWSQETKQGLAVKVKATKKGPQKSIAVDEIIPVIIENYSTPRKATESEAKDILKKLKTE